MNMKKSPRGVKSIKFIKIVSLITAVLMCINLTSLIVFGAEDEFDGKTVILYTGNVRGNIDVYPKIAALRNSYESKGADVVLADTGNYLQGTVYASYDSGKTVINLMDAAGYDVAAIGSHEFDFGTGQVGVSQHEIYYEDDTLGNLLENAAFGATAANIVTNDGELNAFAPNVAVTVNSRKIGFFGLTSPATVNQVIEANFEGLNFVNEADAANEQIAALGDCDLIIRLSNIGGMHQMDGAIVIDVPSDAGLTAGVVVIDNATGEVESRNLLNFANLEEINDTVKAAVDAAKAEIDEEYGADAVVKSEVTLTGLTSAVRAGETAIGNLWTDALLWFAKEGGIENYYDEDEINNGNDGIQVGADNIVAIWNGGNLRDFLNSGDVTMKDIMRVLPYPNKVAVVYLTGTQLLELLEATSQGLPYGNASHSVCSSFMQAAGINYTVAANIPYDAGEAYGARWYKADSIRRVTINNINGNAFDENAVYAVITSNASYNGMDASYICLEKDGDLSTITTAGVTDVVWMYIKQKLGGVIGEEYASAQGRIIVDRGYLDVPQSAQYYDDINYVTEKGLMNGTGNGKFSPESKMSNAMFITMLYRIAGSPEIESEVESEIESGKWYSNAVAWAESTGIIAAGDGNFVPVEEITRNQIALYISRCVGSVDIGDFSGDGTVSRAEGAYIIALIDKLTFLFR